MAHSKRNTSRSIFTSHERQLASAAWGNSTARLTRESFLPLGVCRLCIEPAVDPVSCAHGDVFCRECALTNLIAQRQEIRRLEKRSQGAEREENAERAKKEHEATERAVREFELTQAGLEGTVAGGGRREGPPILAGGAAGGKDGEVSKHVDGAEDSARRGEKRKFSLDQNEVARSAAEARAKARKAIDEEAASKPTLPSFWAPAITPSSNKRNALHAIKKKAKTYPICPASSPDKPHNYSLRTLLTVHFTEDDAPNASCSTRQRICPACRKGLSNVSKATLAKPCGHVLCRSCVGRFMAGSEGRDPHVGCGQGHEKKTVLCYVCETDVTEWPLKGEKEREKDKDKDRMQPGLVELRTDGTGFSAGGTALVKKSGVAFQC